MSVGPLTILQGVGGREETKITEGEEDGLILISQENKVMVMKANESAIIHTWYSSTNQPVVTATKNQDNFENCNYVIVYDEKTVARVNNLGSKLPAFEKTKLKRDVVTLKPMKGDHLVIFTDGTISSLKGLIKSEEDGTSSDDWYSSTPIINTGTETILDTYLLQHGAVASIIHIINSDSQLKLCHARLGSSGEGEKPVLSGVEIITLGPMEEFQAWDVYTGTPGYVLLWKKSGEILYSESFTAPSWIHIHKETNSYDSEICALSKDYCAIAFSKHDEDGGSLQIISLQFKLVSSEAALKTTIHKGRGLFYVSDYLFMVGGGRVAFGTVTELNKQLDEYIGLGMDANNQFGTMSLYQNIPKLLEAGDLNKAVQIMTASLDVPEDLVLDFLQHITNEEKNQLTTEERKEYLGKVIHLELSNIVLASELARLDIKQSLLLIELICSILEDGDLPVQNETRLVSWLDLILSNNYVHTVVSKDERTSNVIEVAYQRILTLQQEMEAAIDLTSILTALPSLYLNKHDDNTSSYSIQIKHL